MIYEFTCQKCGASRDVWASIKKGPPKVVSCPDCQKPMVREWGGFQTDMNKHKYWGEENSGRGREIAGLQEGPLSKPPTFRSQRELLEHCRRNDVPYYKP